MATLVLTAGKGTRLHPFTQTIPKPAFPIWRTPLFKIAINPLINIENETFVFNLFHLPNIMKANVEFFMKNKKISFSLEQPEILGSGGAIKAAQKYLNTENFFYVNGDEIFLTPSAWTEAALEIHKYKNALATLITTHHPELLKRFKAIWVDEKNNVRGFGQEPPGGNFSLKPLHFTGYQILNKKIFNSLPIGESNIFYDVLVKNIALGETITSFQVDGLWLEAGDTQSLINTYASLGEEIFNNTSKLNLNMFPVKDIKNEFIPKTCPKTQKKQYLHSKNNYSSTSLSGFCFVEKNVDFAPNVHIENSILLPNTTISNNINNSIEGLDQWKNQFMC